MLITREALNAALFASYDKTRYAVQNIRLDPDGTVWATNGHIAVRVTQTPETIDDADYPVGALGLPDDTKPPTTRIYIPADVALDAAKALKRLRPNLPILAKAVVRVSNEWYYIGMTDLERPTIFKFKPIEVDYPNIESVFPKEDAEPFASSVTLNGNYLSLVCRLRSMFNGRDSAIKITSYGSDEPVSFRWSLSYDGLAVHAIVMPMQG